jgi:O-phospho-L-seryl-tRNASec:L-selenocysteinyl-tRNA synthase
VCVCVDACVECPLVDSRRAFAIAMQILLQQRKLPENGWDDQLIELFLYEISVMDSNNFVGNVGVGEREARVASALVARRHYGLGHGVGRSGDIAAIQPKAAGSSLMARLTESLALDLIRLAGIKLATACIVLPLATGMGLVMTLLTLRARRPGARFVIWPRIDQKSCFKAISTAGFVPVVIQNKLKGDEVVCDVEALESKVMELGPENVLAVVTTTSCFAPRTPDPLPEIAKFCKDKSVPHVVNNAYGLQSSKCCFLVNEAIRVGRLDAFVSSTDKNLLVPVGGSLVASPDPEFVAAISKTCVLGPTTPMTRLRPLLLDPGWWWCGCECGCGCGCGCMVCAVAIVCRTSPTWPCTSAR